jgi:L-amino acid N-acyltransferase
MINIRKAETEDIEFIASVYNHAVLNTTATFDTEAKSLKDRRNWFLDRSSDFPVVIAEKNGEKAGYASLNKWSDKKAYNITAEISVYVDIDFRGLGIGKKLIKIITEIAISDTQLHSIIARITEGNEHSIYLHELAGFERIGTMKQAGRKFGKLLDVTFMQKMLR